MVKILGVYRPARRDTFPKPRRANASARQAIKDRSENTISTGRLRASLGHNRTCCRSESWRAQGAVEQEWLAALSIASRIGLTVRSAATLKQRGLINRSARTRSWQLYGASGMRLHEILALK